MVKEDKEKKETNKNNTIFMKEKILIFVIGFLVGAIVATSGCIVYNKIKAPNNEMIESNDFKYGRFPEMNGDENNKESRPEMNGEKPDEKSSYKSKEDFKQNNNL